MDQPGRQQSGTTPERGAVPGARRPTAADDAAPDTLAQRLTSQFAPAYLTLASIIQGVALSTLVLRVEATYAGFDAVAWLLTLATFLTCLIVWHEYVLQVLAFVWMPTVLDTVVPFAFLAAELLLAHCVYQNLRLWLLALGLVSAVGLAAGIVTALQTRAFPQNRAIVRALSPHRRARGVLNVLIVVLCVSVWALYDVLRLGQVQLSVALTAVVGILVWIGSAVPYGNRLRAYARGTQRAEP